MLTYSLLYELDHHLTKEELNKLEKQIEEAHEDYFNAVNELEKKAELIHEAECEAREELINDPDYIAHQETLTPPKNYFQIKKEILTRKTLIFGLNKNPSGTVSSSEWELFKKEHITPLFPGFTEIEVKGNWEGQPENSIELIIACSDNFSNEHKINKIMKAYNQKFNQDCVMKTNSDNTVELYEKR